MSTEARDEAVDVMARAMFGKWFDRLSDEDRAAWEATAEEALDALTKPRTAECSECGGSGSYAEHDPGCWGNCEKHGCPIQAQCQPCSGSGTVTRGPIAVLTSELEQVGWWDDEYRQHRNMGVAVHPKYVPLYRRTGEG